MVASFIIMHIIAIQHILSSEANLWAGLFIVKPKNKATPKKTTDLSTAGGVFASILSFVSRQIRSLLRITKKKS